MNESLLEPAPPPRRSPVIVAVAIAVAVVAANAVAYVAYRATRSPTSDDGSVKALAAEQRGRGVAALRDGHYARAIVSLEAAQRLDPSLADVPALIEVARKLEVSEREPSGTAPAGAAAERAAEAAPDRAGAADGVAEAAPDRAAAPDREAASPEPAARAAEAPARTIEPVARAVERAATRDRPAVAPPSPRPAAARVAPARAPAPARDVSGALLVTTNPPRLLLRVDGRPVDTTPVRLELPVGKHQITVLDGARTLLDRTVDINADSVAVIDETFGPAELAARAVETPRAAETPKPTPATSELADDARLDLAKLTDRRDDAAPTEAARVPAVTPPRATGAPRVLVYAPGRSTAVLAQSLGAGLPGVEVRVLARAADLKDALGAGADAVVAAPAALAQSGLSASIGGVGKGRWVAVSMDPAMTRAKLPSVTLGMVDELGRKGMSARAAEILDVSSAVSLRRVTKLEDLVSTLQLELAAAVIVRDGEVEALRVRTQRPLNVIELKAADSVAVAFVAGGRRAEVERAILALGPDARAALGVERWSTK